MTLTDVEHSGQDKCRSRPSRNSSRPLASRAKQISICFKVHRDFLRGFRVYLLIVYRSLSLLLCST